MSRRRLLILACAGLVVAGTAVTAQQTGFVRTPLSDSEMSVAGRHGVMARVEIDAGVSSGRHTHPGEEFGYIVDGTFQVTIDGKAPTTLKVGEVFLPGKYDPRREEHRNHEGAGRQHLFGGDG